jgi:hypothetical protein
MEGRLKILGMQREKQLCIYCGIRPAVENEHVIGKVFYIQRPKKAITVPSCSACNRGRGDGGTQDLHLDEEYMRTILCMTEGCSNHPVAVALLETNIARSFRRRNRGLRQRLLKSIQRTERWSTGGVFQPYSSPFIRPDFSRFQRVLRKITKGLFYHVLDKPLPTDYQVLVNPFIKPHEVPVLVEKLRAKGDPSEYQTADEYDVFKFMVRTGNDSRTEWLLRFYDWAVFHSWTLPRNETAPGDTGMPIIRTLEIV